mmetsp:Transcript_5534/g.17515  ORF Transcript_5534/g.17515 Transcript_5534/m.17515 type:complete len:203 (-) Transcript_5534:1006-1614(-)
MHGAEAPRRAVRAGAARDQRRGCVGSAAAREHVELGARGVVGHGGEGGARGVADFRVRVGDEEAQRLEQLRVLGKAHAKGVVRLARAAEDGDGVPRAPLFVLGAFTESGHEVCQAVAFDAQRRSHRVHRRDQSARRAGAVVLVGVCDAGEHGLQKRGDGGRVAVAARRSRPRKRSLAPPPQSALRVVDLLRRRRRRRVVGRR